jgi:carboxypeptidase C (cathepsin A)
LKNAAGEPIGSIFSFSYIADGLTAQRPVTFVFNGGPGSSSVWLHLGIGPKRLSFKDPLTRVTPPYTLIENPDSPFAVSDLVFVDPVGTGFSRFLDKGAAADFYGDSQDANTVAQSIFDLGLFDARYTLPKKVSHDAIGLSGQGMGEMADDPFVSQITPAFTGAFHTYLWKELRVVEDMPYIVVANLDDQWKDSEPHVDAGDALVDAMRRNRELQVMFLGGWFDAIAGTVGAAEYGAAKRLPPDRTTVKAYPSGHMCYIGDSGTQVGRDIAAFIVQAAPVR